MLLYVVKYGPGPLDPPIFNRLDQCQWGKLKAEFMAGLKRLKFQVSVYALSWFSWVVTDHVFLGRNGTSFTGGVRFWDLCPPVGILAHPPPTRAPLRPDRDANPDTPP